MSDSSHQPSTDHIERRARRLNFWVVWGFAVVDVMLALFQPIRAADNAAVLLGIAAVTCQVSLLTIWVALGQKNLKERLLMAAPAFGLAAWFLGALDSRDFFEPAALALLYLFLFDAIMPYAFLRLLGVRCLPPWQAITRQTLDRRRGPMQFSLAALFKMTFVAACAAAVIRLLKPQVELLVAEAIAAARVVEPVRARRNLVDAYSGSLSSSGGLVHCLIDLRRNRDRSNDRRAHPRRSNTVDRQHLGVDPPDGNARDFVALSANWLSGRMRRHFRSVTEAT